MKKLSFLLATLLIGGMMFTGCKKDDPKPTPDPESKTTKVVYKLGNNMDTLTVSNCFKYTVSYLGADGQMVKVNDVTLPWTSPELTVTLPFTAKIEGQTSYNEADLPEAVVFGRVYSLLVNGKEFHHAAYVVPFLKEGFIQFVSDDPNVLKFNYSTEIGR
jgi:hypothetical protein